MATFYIDSPSKGILELTSTTNIQINERATATKHKVENGEVISDNMVVDNVSINFNGVISNILRLTQATSQNDTRPANIYVDPVQGYIEDLRSIKASKELFTVRYDSRFPAVPNCILTSLNITRDVNTGLGYKVSLAFDQIRISNRVGVSEERQVQKVPDDTQKESKSGTNNQQSVTVTPLSASISLKEGEKSVYTSGTRQSGFSQDITVIQGE